MVKLSLFIKIQEVFLFMIEDFQKEFLSIIEDLNQIYLFLEYLFIIEDLNQIYFFLEYLFTIEDLNQNYLFSFSTYKEFLLAMVNDEFMSTFKVRSQMHFSFYQVFVIVFGFMSTIADLSQMHYQSFVTIYEFLCLIKVICRMHCSFMQTKHYLFSKENALFILFYFIYLPNSFELRLANLDLLLIGLIFINLYLTHSYIPLINNYIYYFIIQ